MEKNLSLYQVTEQINQVFEEITSLNGEITQEMQTKLEFAQSLLVSKTDACVGWRQSQDDLRAAIEKRVEELLAFLKVVDARVDRFDEYILSCMDRLGQNEFKGELSTIKARKPSQVVEIFDESLIDAQFIKMPEPKPMIMKVEIKNALKNGETVEGARLVVGKKSVLYKVGK